MNENNHDCYGGNRGYFAISKGTPGKQYMHEFNNQKGGLLIMDIHFEGEISCGPITLEYLAKNNISLGIMYRFRETVDDPELQEHFDAVLRMASDMICNTCYELNIDPAVLDYWQPGNDCIVTLYEPEVPD